MFTLWFLAHFIAAGLITMLINKASLIPWRRAATAHWAERARLLWPIRFTSGINVCLIPFILIQLHILIFPNISFHGWIADAIAGFFGSVVGNYSLDRTIYPQLNFRSWRQQTATLWSLRFGIWIVLIGASLLMPSDFGWKMILVTVGYLVLHCLIQWGLLLKYLRLVKFLTPPEQRLQQIVANTTTQMATNVRATWQLRGSMANAFAFPTTREMVFSDRLLEICDDEEISAICAHELGHLKEPKSVLAGRLFGSLTVFPVIFIQPLAEHFGLAGILVPYVVMFSMMLFMKRLSQRMEKRADQLAAKEQMNEGVYARALEKLYRENQSPAVNVNNRQTHPHLYDRMLAAGVTPDFPRPARPKRLTLIGWSLLFACGALVALTYNSN